MHHPDPLPYSSKTEDEFVVACIDLTLAIRKEGRVPEGEKVAELVKRIRRAKNGNIVDKKGKPVKGLPQKKISCGKGVRSDVACYSPGPKAEVAYDDLIAEIRKDTPLLPQATAAF